MEGTEKIQQDLLVDIAGHPQEAPSVDELEHVNPGLDQEQIKAALDDLVEKGFVEVREYDPEERFVIFPNRFYALTDVGRNEFGDEIEAWKREYQSVEKDNRIELIEGLERP